MDGLRWLLLGIGLLVIAGVYWYSQREKKAPARSADAPRVEPSLDAGTTASQPLSGDDPYDSPELGDEFQPEEPATDELADAPPPSEKIVTLRLVAGRRGTFAGDELALALRGVGMRHGRFGIFHLYDGDDEDRVVFSAASLVEPGSFDLANLKGQTFPGVSLFMVLPGPLDGAEAFDRLMSAARALAQKLDGELLDETGSTLSIQRERYMREEIIQYQLGIKVA